MALKHRQLMWRYGGMCYSREEETDGDCPLVARYDGAANPFRCTFGLVHGDEGGDKTDTETGEDTANDVKGDGGRAGLHCDTDTEDQAGEDRAPLAA